MSDTVDVADAVGSYYKQLFMLNPSGIVPQMAAIKTVDELFGLTDTEARAAAAAAAALATVAAIESAESTDDVKATTDLFYHRTEQ